MATKNTRNAALLLSPTLGGTYIKVTKTHGLNLSLTTDFSEDTGHGQNFKSQIPGLSDYTVSVGAWYDTAYTTLEYSALNKVAYYFIIYMDYADVQNYHRGQGYFAFDSLNLDIGNTADGSFSLVLAGSDPQIVRNGTPL